MSPEVLLDRQPGTEPSFEERRPRLLSHVGRWGRARRWLPPEADRVVDVGCAYGYGTVALRLREGKPRWVLGVERDPGHAGLAARSYPWLPLMIADAEALPLPDASADAVVMLDVVEHMADPAAVIAEARRVLRPDGCLVLSVPHKGPLTALDPNNAYDAMRRLFPSWPPLDPFDESAGGTHLHFSVEEMRALLGPGFAVDRVARTGLGVSELLHLAARVVFLGLLRWRAAYRLTLPFHFLAYLIDDLIPAGPLGYHLAMRARPVNTEAPG